MEKSKLSANERARKARERRANRTPSQKARDAVKARSRRKKLTAEQKAEKARKARKKSRALRRE